MASASDLVDAVVVLEEMGRVPFPGPYFSSAIEATIAARRLGAFELLEPLADGSRARHHRARRARSRRPGRSDPDAARGARARTGCSPA